MRGFTKILFLLFITSYVVPCFGGNPTAYLNFASFSTPSGQNFFETYLSVIGSSLRFTKDKNNKYIGKAHVTFSFMSGDSVVASSNFNAVSPETTDTLNKPNFIDTHRFWLPKGKYFLVFSLDDPNDPSHKTITGKQSILIGYRSDTVNISDAEFLSSFTPSNNTSVYNKCGFDMVPYVFAYYPQSVTRLCFYCEIYNTIKFIPHQKFTIKYAIEDDGDVSLDKGSNFISSTQRDADTVVPFLAQVPIDNLATGNYYLVISILDLNNHLLGKRKYSFTKENPNIKATHIPEGFAVYMANKDTLNESIRCLAPISNGSEQQYVMSDSLNWIPLPELKRWFYYFWVARDSVHPFEAWQKYLSDVIKVNNSFGMPQQLKGYRTDRGRVYLQYGPPNIREVNKMNPQLLPYEIWQYYKLPNDGEINVKFVFYAHAIETNNYELLHSTATGEIHNPDWQYELLGGPGATPSNLDNTTLSQSLTDDFNNPH